MNGTKLRILINGKGGKMSTNYYIVVDNQELYEKIQDEIDTHLVTEWISLKDENGKPNNLQRTLAIHIGSKSWGWEFHFQGSMKSKISSSWKTWKQFIQENNVTIVDEYGDVQSHNEFFELVEVYGAPKWKRDDGHININHYDYCVYTHGHYSVKDSYKGDDGYTYTRTYFS